MQRLRTKFTEEFKIVAVPVKLMGDLSGNAFVN